jgi:hypothetical protein
VCARDSDERTAARSRSDVRKPIPTERSRNDESTTTTHLDRDYVRRARRTKPFATFNENALILKHDVYPPTL